MGSVVHHHKTIGNSIAVLTFDLYGGALTNFHLKDHPVNPISFRFSKSDMPENNRNGAPYQGHFICLGHWGAPSPGERAAGMPNHGQASNIMWKEAYEGKNEYRITAHSELEGLQISRTIRMDQDAAVAAVKETVKNVNPLGRLYSIVQHPTLSHPFLDNTTIIDCNAGPGFNQEHAADARKHQLSWPNGYCLQTGTAIDLRAPEKGHDAVFSFVIPKSEPYGWITAFSPTHQLLFGYIWKRNHYPWIHLWQQFDGDKIRYRSMEFGIAGVHKPFKDIFPNEVKVLDENTCAYIDAGESVDHDYLIFMSRVDGDFQGVDMLSWQNGTITVKGRQNEALHIHTDFADFI